MLPKVGHEMLFLASKIEMKEMEEFVTKTSGMVELLFHWSPHTAQVTTLKPAPLATELTVSFTL